MPAVPKTMRATALDRFGGPEVLKPRRLPTPVPGRGEILIAVHTAGVGSWDADVRAGWNPGTRRPFPTVLGYDGSGTVVALGTGVRRFREGQRVYAYAWDNPKGGFYAAAGAPGQCQTRWYDGNMVPRQSAVASLEAGDLLAATRKLVAASQAVEADLLVHLAEIDERKLYLEWAYPSMFAFCVEDLGFSECAAYNRIFVARSARSLPAVLDAVRSGEIHLAGMRVLVPHLTAENHRDVLARAARKSKREIEELVARLSPQPPVPATIRKLPGPVAAAATSASSPSEPLPIACEPAPSEPAQSAANVVALPGTGAWARPEQRRPAIAPLSADTFKIQFTATQQIRDNLIRAQDLLRHRVPDGDIPTIVGMALELLIGQVMKERFAMGRKARKGPDEEDLSARSRHIPDAVKRFVYERDGGRCAFTDASGKRCTETSALTFEHDKGFARTHEHDPEHIHLFCRAHNQYAAEKMYGRAFMERARATKAEATCPGASSLWITRPAGSGTKSEERLL